MLITLLTDFGGHDVYVGVMKAVLLSEAPSAQLVDLTHEVPPQDVRAGAFHLRQAVGWFPRGTVHLAVVDPGVGSARRAIAIEAGGAFFVGPDNGLFSWAAPRPARAVVLPIPRGVSQTFHGRDVFAPAAGKLAAGCRFRRWVGRPVG